MCMCMFVYPHTFYTLLEITKYLTNNYRFRKLQLI